MKATITSIDFSKNRNVEIKFVTEVTKQDDSEIDLIFSSLKNIEPIEIKILKESKLI